MHKLSMEQKSERHVADDIFGSYDVKIINNVI